MRLISLALLSLLAACGCKSSPTTTPATKTSPATATCASIHAHLVEMYQSEALVKEPARVDAATADNVTMAEHECARAASTFPACASSAASASEFESKCMPKLDDEGSEGDEFTAPRGR